MVISKHTLKRKSTYATKSIMVCHVTGSIYFSKMAAIKLNAPCKISFDFDKGICFYDENDGFEIKLNENGFFIFSNRLTRFISERFAIGKPKFHIHTTIDKSIFELILIK